MPEDQGAEPTTPQVPPGDDEKQTRPPKIALKTPPKREDIPSLQSTVLLMKHEFSSRQRQRLANDKGYQATKVRAEVQVQMSPFEPQDYMGRVVFQPAHHLHNNTHHACRIQQQYSHIPWLSPRLRCLTYPHRCSPLSLVSTPETIPARPLFAVFSFAACGIAEQM